MCGAPLKSIRKQLVPGVVFTDAISKKIWTVLSVNSDRMEARLALTKGSWYVQMINWSFRGRGDDCLSNYTLVSFPKQLEIEDVL